MDKLEVTDIHVLDDPCAWRNGNYGWYSFINIAGVPTIHSEVSIDNRELTKEYADKFLSDAPLVFYYKIMEIKNRGTEVLGAEQLSANYY